MVQLIGEILPAPPNRPATARLVTFPRFSSDGECRMCGGAGFLRTGVPFGDPDFGKLVECRCGLAWRRRVASIDCEDGLGFAPDLQSKRFDGFVAVAGGERALAEVKLYMENPRWLYLHGPVGDGKTHLLAMIVNDLRERGVEALFCVVPGFLDWLRGMFKPGAARDFDETWSYVRSVPFLGLDDLGTEKASEWAEERLYELFNWRYRFQLPTVVTSNLQPDDLRDPRLASRLSDVTLCKVVYCGPKDVRRYQR